jgi:hypothetical protein
VRHAQPCACCVEAVSFFFSAGCSAKLEIVYRKKGNSILNRAGAFWQREYFDRLVRDEAELRRVCRYILQNPIKVGLKDWHWAELCGPEAHTTAGETPALQGKK